VCAACGRENRDIAKYCRFCGKMMPVASTAPASIPPTSTQAASAPAIVIPIDYVGHDKIRAELEKIKSNIKFQKRRQGAGVGGAIGPKIFVFRGKTGAGKTLVAKNFIEELRREECLSSEIITNKEARELSKAYSDEYAIARFLSETKPAALVVDNATETPAYIHELILAASKSTQECVCVIIGNSEGFDEFFGKNTEDRQRVTQDFNFQDLSLEDLSLILMKKLRERGLIFDPKLKKHFSSYIQERKNDSSCEYKNGWLIEKDVIPAIDKNQQARLEKLESAATEDFKTIKAEDLPLKNKPKTTDEILAELDAMIGMTDIKKAVREIANKIQIQKEQEEKDGTKSAGEGNNIVITGNPGTGKTTIVRTLGALFNAIGLLETENVIEVNGNDLKGSFLGESKDKVNGKCDEAMGGILFVDEAYVLADTERGSGAADSYAKEAVEILMTRLENDRTKFVGVVAGYEKEMQILLDKVNPGMRRRFKHYLHLSDYSAEELFAIFNSMVKKAGYTLTPEASEAAKAAINDMYNNKGPNFGNAGEIRVFFEKTTSRLATRLAALSKEGRADKLKIIEACDFPFEKKEERTVNEILTELDAMIGMTDIKKTVREIANKIQIQKEQEEKDGTKSAGEGNNIVITGNPGTGKTTVVRTLGALFNAIGLLKTDTVIEVNGNDLKGSYLGQSKDKVNGKCDEAMGGILFVDEAYVLADTQRGGAVDQYAKEAVEILMTRLENDRTKFVGVIAGYEKEMQVFLDTVNPGMRRRFRHYLHLSDYSAEELFLIFNSMVKKAGYTLTPDASEAAKTAITDMYDNKGPNFGNAGEIRVFFERITSRLATRLAALSKEERADKLKTIEAGDISANEGGAS